MTPKEKLISRLKELGLSEGLAEIITITSDDQIEGIINQLKPKDQQNELDFKKVLSSQEFAKFVTDNGFDKVLETSKTLQSEHDKKVTNGIKTFKEKYFKEIDGDDGKDPEGRKPTTQMTDETPQWAKDIATKLEKLEAREQTSTKEAQTRDLMSRSKLPKKLQDKWLGRVRHDSDTSIEEQIKALETEAEELKIEMLGGTVERGLPTGSVYSSEKEKMKEIESIGKDFVSKHKINNT